MIAVIDYGAGNLRSAVRALQHVGSQLTVTDDPELIRSAQGVVLPGVGATLDTMQELRRRKLIEPIRDVVAAKTPFLGICVGMQVLAETSEEFGRHDCLGIVPGCVRKLPSSAGKVPQIGWNQVALAGTAHPVLAGIPDETDFYFVHSYYVDIPDETLVIGRTDYGIAFPSILASGAVVATQFHPEKSGRWGLALLHNFVRLVESHSATTGEQAASATQSLR